MAEATASAGFDWICIDTQHGWIAPDQLPHVIQVVALSGPVPIVRVAANDPWLIGRALDSGAHGVMVPMVGSPAEAAAAVAACRHQPAGTRSAGAFRRARSLASTPRQADDHVVCIVQIESIAAVEQIDAICQTPGLDVVYIGPTDLALSMGLQSRAELPEDVLWSVRDAALKHGVIPAMHGESGEDAAWAVGAGFRLTTAAADVDCLFAGAANELRKAAHATAARHCRPLGSDDVPTLNLGPDPLPR
jgi:4-hydroxy-2-oxoheptanedioate aldolase